MKSIRNKILIPVILIVILTTVSILTICITRFTSYIDLTVSEELENASKNLANQLDSYKLMSSQAAQLISTDANLVEYIKTNDRENIIKQSQRLQSNAGMDFCTIMDNEGNVIVRAHEPDNFGDSLAKQQNVQSAMNGQGATFIEKGSAVKLSVRSSAPIIDESGTQVAIVSVGCRLDQDAFVDKMKEITGTEITVFLADERIATTVIGADGNRAVGTKAAEDISAQVLGGTPYSGEALVVGQKARVKYTPIEESGNIIGMLFVGQYTKPTDDAVNTFVLTGVIVGAIAILIGIIVGMIISGRIVKPVLKLVEAGDRISLGDIDVDVNVNTKDEIQKLVDSFNRIISANRSQAEAIRAISHGDLTVDVEPRSDADVVNHSLKDMLAMNNEAFSDIVGSAKRVAQCAKDISQGAERLASSSTEQAASVQELSAEVHEVSAQAESNASMAAEGKALGDSITKTADLGSDQMRNMSKAVSEINEASLAIESVIKAIDDIAFQTNLLALNASVEAARAGVHGKGFAVVADEVRNLAGKSAAAAKGTDELIANSVSKARAGSDIAKETSESLGVIVEGVKKSNRIMSAIADASDRQNMVFTQISSGINDVSQIVQQNSATAEQSAAASSVMSEEADELMRLVSKFRLRDPSKGIHAATGMNQNGFSL